MPDLDTDAILWREGTGPDLLVVMHGFGSNEADLFELAPHLPAELTVASLRGPARAPNPGGWSWFEFNPAVDSTDHTMIDASAAAVLGWLDSLGDRFARVHAFGFSQGAAMAVQLVRLAPDRFTSVTHLSSFVHNGDLPGDAALAARQPRIPLFQAIGRQDFVIAADKRERSLPWLDAHFDVERHFYDLDHSVSLDELRDVVAFLTRVASSTGPFHGAGPSSVI